MSRSFRIEYPGALYHITSRGNEKAAIYRNDHDRMLFLSTLAEQIKTHNWICHAYCLMSNHYHLLIETVDANMACGMRDLNGIYSKRFNKVHSRVGHLFQGRYDARLIERDPYLLEVVRYIVLNPVRAHLTRSPAEWLWSSYRATIGKDEKPIWLWTDWTLGLFSKDSRRAQASYAKFVLEGIGTQSPYSGVQNEHILGSDQFIHEIWEKFGTIDDIKEYPREERVIGRLALEDIFSEDQIKIERDEAICLARMRCGYQLSEIARYLKIDPSTVGKVIKNLNKSV